MNILISGGSSGIGQATAQLFAQHGHQVVELSRSGKDVGQIKHITCDVESDSDVARAVQETLDYMGYIDILIANAGFGIAGTFEETSEQDYLKQFNINVFGCVRLIQKVLPGMRARMSGRILITSSLAGDIAVPYQSFYSATKATLQNLALSLHNEVKPFGIGVYVLAPGDICTGFTAHRHKTTDSVYPKMQQSVARMEQEELAGAKADTVARAYYKLACQKFPKPYRTVGLKYKGFYLLWRILPRRLANYIVSRIYG